MKRSITLAIILAVLTPGFGQEPERGNDEQLSPELATILRELLDRDWQEGRPEWAAMAVNILKNEGMGNGRGWFKGAQSRYNWKWLAETFPDVTKDDRIEAREFSQLSRKDFARLDRDENGSISARDLDWSRGNPMMSGFSPSDMVFDRLDFDFNGRLTMDELEIFFRRSSDGFDFLTLEDLRKGLNLQMPNMQGGGGGGGRQRDQRLIMFRRLLNGELGSLTNGPDLEDEAPELNLPLAEISEDRSDLKLTDRLVTLKEFRGKKPVVLVFGSFT